MKYLNNRLHIIDVNLSLTQIPDWNQFENWRQMLNVQRASLLLSKLYIKRFIDKLSAKGSPMIQHNIPRKNFLIIVSFTNKKSVYQNFIKKVPASRTRLLDTREQ